MKIILVLLLLSISLFATNSIEMEYYEDKSTVLDISDIKKLPNSQFKKLDTTKFGFTESAFWLKVKTSSFNTDTNLVLEFLDSRLDEAYLYDNSALLLHSMGDKIPFINREYNDPNIAFTLQGNNLYFIKILNTSKMNLEYKVWNEKEYLSHVEIKNILKAFYFGALCIMLVYNFVVYIFLRERVFLEYVLYHIAFGYVMVYYTGLSAQLFAREAVGLDAATVYIHIAALCTILAVQFLRSFLNTAELTPKIDKVLFSFMVLHAILALFSIFHIQYHLNHIVFNITMMLMSIFMLFVSLYISLVKKQRVALFYFFAWFMMMLGIILTSLTLMTIIPRNDFTTNMFQIGSLFEIALLSMGLAYRYKLKQDELLKKNVIIEEQSKMAHMGEMLQNIAHQWRQPLSEINAVAMSIDANHYNKQLTTQKLDSEIQKIEDITQHMSDTIESFNTYFKKDKHKVKVSPRELINKALRIIETKIQNSKISLNIHIDTDEMLNVNEGELIQVILVILNNSVDALLLQKNMQERVIIIRCSYHDNKHLLEFEDNAGGIAEKVISKVFHPYFTTKFESNGVGIGLYMAKMLVEESMSGDISVLNTKNGARFSITL